MTGYVPEKVEAKWQARWEQDGLHRADLSAQSVFYNLVEFPYPSADGLHVGHVRTYSGADAYGRYQRMRGKAVFQPMGFDSFGINAENYALKTGRHPARLIAGTTQTYERQLRRVGCAWDWSRAIDTSRPEYYRWTQWIFLKLLDAGLAYRAESPVVWCPSCLTTLAFEQVESGNCERCSTPVGRRVVPQWFLRTTRYADALLDGLDELDWPAWAKEAQGEWIGRSAGVDVDFSVSGGDRVLTAFTTRADTLFGVTFLAVSPAHPDAEDLAVTAQARAAVAEMAGAATSESRFEVSGRAVFTGSLVRHPATGEAIPVFVSDAVVAGYGTGVVMGVPAHDDRDHRVAVQHGLAVRRVVEGGPLPWTQDGRLTASGDFTGMSSEAAREAVADWLTERGSGRRAVRYRLRDWLISRQRYWGPPIPVVHCEACGPVGVRESDLPVRLPHLEDYRPAGTGVSPLALDETFVNAPCPACGRAARRETDVSDTFLDSSWYFLRYPCTDLDDRPFDGARIARVLPVDQYEGGREHVRRHHLYARFMCHALADIGLLDFREPIPRVRFHGLMTLEGAKMSKSRGNVVNPDDYVDSVGADNLRLYLLFCGPWEEGGTFSDQRLQGVVRFTRRLWRTVLSSGPPASALGVDTAPLQETIRRVTSDIESYRFNTAIAALMEGVRWASSARESMTAEQWTRTREVLVKLTAPFAPHLADELWERIGGAPFVHTQPWPSPEPLQAAPADVQVVVQVNGKTRDVMVVAAGLDQAALVTCAMQRRAVARHVEDGAIRDVVVVPGRLVNLVVEPPQVIRGEMLADNDTAVSDST